MTSYNESRCEGYRFVTNTSKTVQRGGTSLPVNSRTLAAGIHRYEGMQVIETEIISPQRAWAIALGIDEADVRIEEATDIHGTPVPNRYGVFVKRKEQ